MLTAISQIIAAFGLSGASGLNAYIPLLIVGIAARLDWLKLSPPFDLLQNEFVIGALVILLFIETFVDKIPAVDTINDIIQTFIRPAAGAILFAAEARVITELNPVAALILGLIIAFGVHATKATARVTVSAATVGLGNWFVSLVEDIIAFFVSLLAVLAPIVIVFIAAIFIFFLARWWLARHSTPPPKPVNWPR